jgi:hypothetical protein
MKQKPVNAIISFLPTGAHNVLNSQFISTSDG